MSMMWINENRKHIPRDERIISHGPDGSKSGLMVCISDVITGYSSKVITTATIQTITSNRNSHGLIWQGNSLIRIAELMERIVLVAVLLYQQKDRYKK